MRVVCDTNVCISAFVIPGSLSDDAYRRARLGDIDLFNRAHDRLSFAEGSDYTGTVSVDPFFAKIIASSRAGCV